VRMPDHGDPAQQEVADIAGRYLDAPGERPF
jgi:hypothetical protein